MQTLTQEYGGQLAQTELLKSDVSGNLRVAIPGIIKSFDAVTQTVKVQPAVREIIYDGVGTPNHIDLPELLDVPIIMPHAGDYAITLPIQQGDECLVIYADMCIDGWWQSGGVQNQVELRRHDLSDGFAILGPWSQTKRLANYDANKLHLYNIKTGTGIEVDGQGIKVTGNVEITGNILTHGDSEIKGSSLIQGDGELKGVILGQLTAKGVDLVTHTHTCPDGQTGGPQ